jgi:hypothetical protein
MNPLAALPAMRAYIKISIVLMFGWLILEALLIIQNQALRESINNGTRETKNALVINDQLRDEVYRLKTAYAEKEGETTMANSLFRRCAGLQEK